MADDLEALAAIAVDCGFHLHRDLGPGLFESVYETVLASLLEQRGLRVQRQQAIPLQYQGLRFAEAFRADVLIEGRLLIELKSIEQISAVHIKQLTTYLRLLNQPMGLLMNFGAPTFKQGVRRVTIDLH